MNITMESLLGAALMMGAIYGLAYWAMERSGQDAWNRARDEAEARRRRMGEEGREQQSSHRD